MTTYQDKPVRQSLSVRQQLRILAIAAAGAIGIALLIALVHALRPAPPPPPPPPPPGTVRLTRDEMAQLSTAIAGSGSDPGSVAATGTISVDEDHSTPVVLPYSGQIAEVFVQAGQHVTQNQPLLRIASPEFVDARNALFAAAAQRATAASQLQTASDNERRQSAIYRTAGGALKDFRQATNDRIVAESALRTANAALGAARDKLALLGKNQAEIAQLEKVSEVAGIYSLTTFHAPVSGVIASRDVAPGQYVGTGADKPLMTITDLTRVWLVAQVDQTDASHVHLGDKVTVTTPAYPGRVFRAVVDNIGAEVDPATHRLPVRATVANPDEALKPDMFASFSIRDDAGPARPASAVLVPASAVIHEGDTARVWVVERDGLLRARAITVVDSANGTDRIGAGLSAGERIVTSGAIFVNEAGVAG